MSAAPRGANAQREVGDHKFHSPYRCRACNERFWVVSRKARTAAIVATVCSVGLALLIAFLIVSVRDDDAAASDATTAAREDEPAPPPGRSRVEGSVARHRFAAAGTTRAAVADCEVRGSAAATACAAIPKVTG